MRDMKGEITKALEDGLELRKRLMADGTPEREADHIIGEGLKAVLSNTRSEPWRFYCEHCRDTGFITVTPSDEELARVERTYGSRNGSAGHVVKCEPCKWQQLERQKRWKQTGDESGDDLIAAGQIKKPQRKFTKFGG